jgi:hypothetical protein
LFTKTKGSSSNAITNIACLVVVGIIVYAIYKTCIAPTDPSHARRSVKLHKCSVHLRGVIKNIYVEGA